MPPEAVLDPRFAALPRLIREASQPKTTDAEVRRFVDELLQADPALFRGALHFLSREGHGFVLVRRTGEPMDDERSWLRWPLRRLFAHRRPSLITNPVSGRRGLAIPFCVQDERYVVVAPLRQKALDAAKQTFLSALQSIVSAPPLAGAHSERVPRFVWLGTRGALFESLQGIARSRGWPLVHAPTFGHALVMLEDDRVDVALLEAGALKHEIASLRALRHAAKIADAPIVYFCDGECDAEIQTLIDYQLPAHPDEGDLLRALKNSAADISRMRAQGLRARVARLEDLLYRCADLAELAEQCARAALTLGADAASVMLADRNGGVYAAHLPVETMLGDHWPTPFMTGETIAQTYVNDLFYEEAFDERNFAARVRDLHPISAAALPIATPPQIVGTVLAISRQRPMFQPEFDALRELCECTGRVASTLREPRAAGPWHRAMLGEAMIEVFQGSKAGSSLCVRADGGRAAIVMLERQDNRRAAAIAKRLLIEPNADLRDLLPLFKEDARGIFIGIVEDGDRLRFACEGVPVPLRVPLSGPVAAHRPPSSLQAGTIALDDQSLALVHSSEFAQQVHTAELVGAVQRGLRTSRATLARSLPRLGTRVQHLAFACITMLSSVDSRRPSALV